MKVLRFSIGFGRPLFRWQGKDDTEYVIAAIPLGGYVAWQMSATARSPRRICPARITANPCPSALRLPPRARSPISCWRLLVLWGLFFRGEVGIVPEIDTVTPNSLAEAAGLQAGQEIIAIDGRETPTVAAVNFACSSGWGFGHADIGCPLSGVRCGHRV
ncbi:MAG: hypothetical protein CM15mP92_1880 [Halieaceae bacterium]|nr:MAG: hypothetical protein CM15mP92_1880 [Halieaceae bacterium]